MTQGKRLIETAFPLTEASAASLHEKNMRHGHISTLHLWPARRPLAASRAALIAALTPDPGSDDERSQAVRRLGGRLVSRKEGRKENARSVEVDKVEAEGGVLWWGHEGSTEMDWFRERIRQAHGGERPRVLDPFSGGGAIPLEALRLGCDVTANDLNPVAWFLLRCTLEYPHRLAGLTAPLPEFARRDPGFAQTFLKALGYKGRKLASAMERMAGGHDEAASLFEAGADDAPWNDAELGWHVMAWGGFVLAQARRALAARYPIYAHWEPLEPGLAHEPRDPRLLATRVDGTIDVSLLNHEADRDRLKDPRTPRWVPKPTVAYLWARTVKCKSCRATVPLLKTRWLCKKDGKRVALAMSPNSERTGVEFKVVSDIAEPTGTAAQKRQTDAALGGGTMSRTGVSCPCCNGLMTMEDMRYEGKNGRLGQVMTCVVVNGPAGKEYRDPTAHEREVSIVETDEIHDLYSSIPGGLPNEPTPRSGSGASRAFSVAGYGLETWDSLFTRRQIATMGFLVGEIRKLPALLAEHGYPEPWIEPLTAYMAVAVDRTADFGSSLCSWIKTLEAIRGTFGRFALPMVWDFAEVNPLSGVTGDFSGAVEWITKVCLHTSKAAGFGSVNSIRSGTAATIEGEFDAIITDPPYYDAIPYSDLMDFFYVWLRRSLSGLFPEIDRAFAAPLGPKWDHDKGDGELIDDANRFGGDRQASKKNFEDGMATVFKRCNDVLKPDGVLVIVFANKSADAWETLVGAVIRAGFVVEGSLPIQTERGARNRSINSAALSSSVWLVCRKRPAGAQRGWSTAVVRQMRSNIAVQMRRFWDAGIRGPDFVWAATGPALEAYSRHPVVSREGSASGRAETMPVSEFLREVRRLVVEFAVGRVLRPEDGDGEAGALDDVTTYYVLHRDTFGLAETPVGAAILYATSCGVSDAQLVDQYELLGRLGAGRSVAAPDDEDDVADEEEVEVDGGSSGGGSKVRLLRWDERRRKNLGLEGIAGKAPPMIDCLHRLMKLWREGDQGKVDAYVEQSAAVRDKVFAHLVQAIIELARRDGKTDEASLLESISNHLRSRSGISAPRQANLL